MESADKERKGRGGKGRRGKVEDKGPHPLTKILDPPLQDTATRLLGILMEKT